MNPIFQLGDVENSHQNVAERAEAGKMIAHKSPVKTKKLRKKREKSDNLVASSDEEVEKSINSGKWIRLKVKKQSTGGEKHLAAISKNEATFEVSEDANFKKINEDIQNLKSEFGIHPRWDEELLHAMPSTIQFEECLIIARRVKALSKKLGNEPGIFVRHIPEHLRVLLETDDESPDEEELDEQEIQMVFDDLERRQSGIFYENDEDEEAQLPLLQAPPLVSFSDIPTAPSPKAKVGSRCYKEGPLFDAEQAPNFKYSEIETDCSVYSISSETLLANVGEVYKIREDDPRHRVKRRWPIVEKTATGRPFNLSKHFANEFESEEDGSCFTDTTFSLNEGNKFMKNLATWNLDDPEIVTGFPSQILVPSLPTLPGPQAAKKHFQRIQNSGYWRSYVLKEKSDYGASETSLEEPRFVAGKDTKKSKEKDPPSAPPRPPKNLALEARPARWVPIPAKRPRGETKIDDLGRIWDVPPADEANKLKDLPRQEEANLMWVPFRDVKPPYLHDGSDDLRSINSQSLSSQSDVTDWMDETRSDVTMSESEWKGDQELAEPVGFLNRHEVWKKNQYKWALKNRLNLAGYRDEDQFDRMARREHQKHEDQTDKSEEAEKKMKIKADLAAKEIWDKNMEHNVDEILMKRVNRVEMCRIQMALQNLDQKLVDQEKESRKPLDNARKYVEESYCNHPSEEMAITQIAFESVDKIDNYIQSCCQDRWEHLYRCSSPRYTHDWARVRMSSDQPDDCDFYDACHVFPWQEVFEKVAHKYKNKLICASSPMYNVTVGILWHWLFENDVKYVVMLNQFLEKGLQASEVWFPLVKGEKARFRRNAYREYIVECTDVKKKYKAAGIQRLVKVTLVHNHQVIETKQMKILHMLEWDQDCLPENWQPYVRICERMNRESLHHPVVVMSKHGSGRAMTLILSLMAAVMARLDDDLSIHSMCQSGRASKRQSITCCNQVYFWRMVHYELLFRWFKPLRELRVRMPERLEAYQDVVIAQQKDYLQLEARHWATYFEYEMERFIRMEYMVEHVQKQRDGDRHEMRELRKTDRLHQAMTASEERDERSPYFDGKPIRRKPLRLGDKPRDPKRPKRQYVKREDFLPEHELYSALEMEPMISGYQISGAYRWVKPSEMKKVFTEKIEIPQNWKCWYTKEEQKGMLAKETTY